MFLLPDWTPHIEAARAIKPPTKDPKNPYFYYFSNNIYPKQGKTLYFCTVNPFLNIR